MQKLSFEAVEQWILEHRSTAQQVVRAQQEKAIQEAEQREREVRLFKVEQKQIMIKKEKHTCENERGETGTAGKRGGETTRNEHEKEE